MLNNLTIVFKNNTAGLSETKTSRGLSPKLLHSNSRKTNTKLILSNFRNC